MDAAVASLINPRLDEIVKIRDSWTYRQEYVDAKVLLKNKSKGFPIKYASWNGDSRESLLEWIASIPEHVQIYAGDGELCADEWVTVDATEEELAKAQLVVDNYVEVPTPETLTFRKPIPFTSIDKD